MLQPGDKAPEFTLRSSEREQVSLKGFRGKNVLILFFPAAFTSVCTTELSMMRDNLAQYEALDTQILAISVDSLYTLHKWKEEQQFNFTLLSDFNKTVSKKYDTLYRNFVFEMKGVSKRSAFLIDREGIIRYAEVLENAGELPNFDKIRAAMESTVPA